MKRKYFPVKKLSDDRAMLNVACGSRTHWQWNNIDFSPIIFLARHPFIAIILYKIGLLSSERFKRIQSIDPTTINFNLRNGIPFEDSIFDVIYHSHFLEHLDKEVAPKFLEECYRCLKKDGILRIVVPDLKILAEEYLSSYENIQAYGIKDSELLKHNQYIYNLLNQMIVKEPVGTKRQIPIVRLIERMLRGNSDKAGELHRWMYDQYTLTDILEDLSFQNIRVENFDTSKIQDWKDFKLDVNDDNSAYIEHSLYIEATK